MVDILRIKLRPSTKRKLRKFADKLLTLREKFSVSQTEMAKHFKVGLRIYQKYENGKAEPEGITYGKWTKRIDELDKLQTLPPLIYEQSPKSIKVESANYVPSSIEELKSELLKKEMEIESLKEHIGSLNLLVKLLSEKAGVPLEKYRNQPT